MIKMNGSLLGPSLCAGTLCTLTKQHRESSSDQTASIYTFPLHGDKTLLSVTTCPRLAPLPLDIVNIIYVINVMCPSVFTPVTQSFHTPDPEMYTSPEKWISSDKERLVQTRLLPTDRNAHWLQIGMVWDNSGTN